MSTALATIEAPESVLLKKADALELYTSPLQRRLIISSGSTAIVELPTEDEREERVAKVLQFAFLDMGIKAKPTGYDVKRLINFLEENHPKFTTADLKAAFDMFLAGHFDEQLPENFGHFQQFSVAFYGKILRRYVIAQAEARGMVRHKVQSKQLLLAAPQEPRERIEFRSLSIIREQVAAIVENGSANITMPGFTFDWLVRLKVCDVVENPTEQERVDALRRLREHKGRGVAFTWKMQRVLAGEQVDDVEWEAVTYKRTRALFATVQAKGMEALHLIDAELSSMRTRARDRGIELEALRVA